MSKDIVDGRIRTAGIQSFEDVYDESQRTGTLAGRRTAGDRPYPYLQKNKIIYFQLYNRDENPKSPIHTHALLINPEELILQVPARVGYRDTLLGAFSDNFGGLGISKLNIKGHTGWNTRLIEGSYVDGKQAYDDLYHQIYKKYYELQQQQVKNNKDPEQIELIFVDTLDDLIFKVQMDNFILRRNRSKPLLFQFDISMTILKDLKTDIPPPLDKEFAALIANPSLRIPYFQEKFTTLQQDKDDLVISARRQQELGKLEENLTDNSWWDSIFNGARDSLNILTSSDNILSGIFDVFSINQTPESLVAQAALISLDPLASSLDEENVQNQMDRMIAGVSSEEITITKLNDKVRKNQLNNWNLLGGIIRAINNGLDAISDTLSSGKTAEYIRFLAKMKGFYNDMKCLVQNIKQILSTNWIQSLAYLFQGESNCAFTLGTPASIFAPFSNTFLEYNSVYKES